MISKIDPASIAEDIHAKFNSALRTRAFSILVLAHLAIYSAGMLSFAIRL